MADETINQPQVQPVELSRAEERIRQLSDKVELTSKERDELKTLVTQKDERIASLEKENTFNSSFADILGSHPQAKDHKDEIKTKVLAGYTPQDATFAVLGAAGKLGGNISVTPTQVAGGAAAINVPSDPKDKPITDMSPDEIRNELSQRLIQT